MHALLRGTRHTILKGRGLSSKLGTAALIAKENRHCAHNYHPLPIVFARAEGAKVYDPEGREYLDFLSAYSAVNQGHCHPRIVAAAEEQLRRCTLSSRAFHNDQLGPWAEMMTTTFGYDAVLPMNTGAEAVETAVKLARRWGYLVKGVPDDRAVVLHAEESFHGRTLTAISMSTDPSSYQHHGPLAPGFAPVRYGDTADLRAKLAMHGGKVVAVVLEPIQGEAGIIIPPPGYMAAARAACDEFGALLVADEVQTGIGRTGRMLAIEHDDVRPDMVILGKALGGGVLPISCVLADAAVMGTVVPGVHGSTFGGNPLACAVSRAAMGVLLDEGLIKRAEALGELWVHCVAQLAGPGRLVTKRRGRGLLQALELDEARMERDGYDAFQLCEELKERGVLAKPTHGNIIRFAPPLVITKKQLEESMKIIVDTMKSFKVGSGESKL